MSKISIMLKEAKKNHLEKLGVKPYIIGMFWNNPESLIDNIKKAIDNKEPYNEEKLLSKEELIAFNNGELVF